MRSVEPAVAVVGCLVLLACEAAPGSFVACFYRSGSALGSAVTLAQGDRVSAGDEIFLELKPSAPLNVYVLNEDAAGRTTLLFPCQGLDAGSHLETGIVHRLPRRLAAVTTFWPVYEATVRERLWVLAGRQPVEVLETVWAEASPAAPCAAPCDGRATELLTALRRAAPRLRTESRASEGLPSRRVTVPTAEGGSRQVSVTLLELSGDDRSSI
jgi:hypothetical protein